MMDVETSVARSDKIRPLSIGIVPAASTPNPVLLQNEQDASVIFDALEEGSNTWCGCAMVRLEGCLITRFGYPNDRELLALMGLHVYPQGAGVYGIFEVHNSSWIADIQQQQQSCRPESVIPARRHILITFQDSTFEAIAQSVNVVLLQGTRDGALVTAVSTLSQLLSQREWLNPPAMPQNIQSGYSIGLLNDLWKYSPSTGLWVWVSGTNTFNSAGVYGTQGVSAASNIPAAWREAIAWTHKDGIFWLYGGMGANIKANDDLWRFDTTTNLWTWVAGTGQMAAVFGSPRNCGPRKQSGTSPGSRGMDRHFR
jgi:hypothetical protein